MVSHFALAQTYTLEGRLTDSGGEGLPNATLLILQASDSTMVNYGLTDVAGAFRIPSLAATPYLLRISYVGFATLTLPLDPPEGDLLSLGDIELQDVRTLLDEVTVQQERIPMRVRGDTIEYDALAFSVRPNEVVEDLIRRMPGIEVDTEGNVIAQGEQVRRVLVDGREFFGRDPRMATQNLPAEAVSKVHVFDERSEQARFTGIDDGQRERTMNLELKEEHRQGMFGNTTLGYGPEDHYQGRSNINRFDAKGQLSLLAMANNLNQQGFSISEYMNFSGGTQSLLSGGGGRGGAMMGNTGGIPISADGRPGTNGIMTSWAAGLNLNRTLREHTDVNASYFFNQLDHDIQRDTERENFLPGGNYDFMQVSRQENNSHNHRLNTRMEHELSDNSSLVLTANASFNRSDSQQESDSYTHSFTGSLQNASEQSSLVDGSSQSINSSLLWRQRLGLPGRTLTFGINAQYSDNDMQGSLEAENVFYRETPEYETILQKNFQESMNRSLGFNTSYTEPLGNRRYLEVNYRLTQNRNEVDQRVFDLEGDQELPNEQLTNIYHNTYLYQRGGLNFRLNRDAYNITLGASLQASSLRGEIVTQDIPVEGSYLNVLPVLRFNYEFSGFRRLMADIETSVQEPSLLQLQPLVDNRDPLNIYQGNPNLRPAYRSRAQIRYNTFNPLNSFGFFTFVTAEYVSNAITNAVTVDEQLIRTIMPVNTDNNLNLRGNFNMNFGIERLKSRMMLGTTLSHLQSTDILNEVSQRISNNILGANARLTFRPGDDFNAHLTANVNQQLTAYEFSSLEQAFLNQTYGVETDWRFLKYYRLNLGFRYQVYQGRTDAFDREIPMLDFGFSRQFLRNNAGELRLTGYNLLDQDLGITQRVDVNFIERQVSNSLGRYFLLSFTYSLNRELNVFDGAHRGGGGGGRRMIVH